MNRLARRLAATVGLGAVALVAVAGPAAAHTEADADAASAGRTAITFTSEPECADGAQPTSGLRVQLPQGATDVQPSSEGGWTTKVLPTEVSWSSTDPAPGTATFEVEMVLAQPVGQTVYLPAIQVCPGGEEIAWIQVPATPGEKLDKPSPSIVVPANSTTATTADAVGSTTSTASGPTTTARMSLEQTPITQEGSTTNNAGLVVFIVVVVAIGGGAIVLYLRHRNTGNTTPGPGPGTPPPAA